MVAMSLVEYLSTMIACKQQESVKGSLYFSFQSLKDCSSLSAVRFVVMIYYTTKVKVVLLTKLIRLCHALGHVVYKVSSSIRRTLVGDETDIGQGH